MFKNLVLAAIEYFNQKDEYREYCIDRNPSIDDLDYHRRKLSEAHHELLKSATEIDNWIASCSVSENKS